MVFEDILRQSKPFLSSLAPAGLEDMGYPVRRIVRYSETVKAERADFMARARQYDAKLKAQKRMARLTKSQPIASDFPDENTPIDAAELRSIINTFTPFLQNDHEEEELSILARRYLQQDPQGVHAFKLFTRMLRSRR